MLSGISELTAFSYERGRSFEVYQTIRNHTVYIFYRGDFAQGAAASGSGGHIRDHLSVSVSGTESDIRICDKGDQ